MLAARRSKRSVHPTDADAESMVDSSGAQSQHPPAKHAKASLSHANAGQRRALADVTNQAANSAAVAPGGKPVTRRSQKTIEEPVKEEAEHKPLTRAQARAAPKVSTRSAASASTAAAIPSAHVPAAASRSKAPAAAPIAPPSVLEEEEEEEEEDEEEDMEGEDEEDAEMADADSIVERKEAELGEDEELTSAKTSAAVAPVTSTASSTAASSTSHAAGVSAASSSSSLVDGGAVAAPARSEADMASWQLCLDDPCQEYSDAIYAHLRATELAHFPDPLYMEHVQGDLTHAMRSILVDWLNEVAQEYKLKPQTLFLAVSYIDRFLSKVQIDRSKLQLVGITAMLLAAKYWEIWPPSIDEFVFISESTYTKEEVLAMENSMLTALKFKLTTPTSWEMSRRFLKAANADKKTEMLVDYLLELLLQESPSLSYRPSILAASALFLSLYTLHLSPWSERLEQCSGIRVEELQSAVRVLHTVYVKTYMGQNTLKAVKEKFATAKFMGVANIKPRNM